MSRYLEPTPTRANAPSHSPPDVRDIPGLRLARAMGWISLAVGAAQLLPRRGAPRRRLAAFTALAAGVTLMTAAAAVEG